MSVVAKLLLADSKWKNRKIVHGAWLAGTWRACVRFGTYARMPHGSYDPVRLAYHGWKKRLVRPIERFFLRRAECVLATCEAERRWIAAYEPKATVEAVDIKRFFRLENPPDVRPFHVPLRLLYLGRRHPLKGVAHLVRAVAELREGVELRQVSNAFGAEKEKVWDWCDVLVLPTLSENFGLVVAEALERGKRVITTDGAPAWGEGGCLRDAESSDSPGVRVGYGGRLLYLEGYRDGTADERTRLLKAAIERMRERGA